jgi:hypothetical protein
MLSEAEVVIQPTTVVRKTHTCNLRGFVGDKMGQTGHKAGSWSAPIAQGIPSFDVFLKVKLDMDLSQIESILGGGPARKSFEDRFAKALRSASQSASALVVIDELKMSADAELKVSCKVTFECAFASQPLVFAEGGGLNEDNLDECLRDESLLNSEQELTVLKNARFVTFVDCSSEQLPNMLLRIVSSEDEITISAPWALVNLLPSGATFSLYQSDQEGAKPIDTFTISSGAERVQFSTTLSQKTALYMSLSFEGYSSEKFASILLSGGEQSIQEIFLVDDRGAGFNAKLQASAKGREGQLTVKVFVDMVIINRTGLPLALARCIPSTGMCVPMCSHHHLYVFMSHLDRVIINFSSTPITGDSASDIRDVLQPDGSIKRMLLQEAATNGSVDNDHKKCVERLGDEWIVRYAR